jgi:hypothetical protein
LIASVAVVPHFGAAVRLTGEVTKKTIA